jgi:hypothetical protein
MLTSRHGIAFLASTVIINCRKKIRDRQHVSYSRTKNSLPLSLFLITPTQTLELKWTSHNRINGKSIYIWRWLVFYGTINRTLIQCKLIAILWRQCMNTIILEFCVTTYSIASDKSREELLGSFIIVLFRCAIFFLMFSLS